MKHVIFIMYCEDLPSSLKNLITDSEKYCEGMVRKNLIRSCGDPEI